MQNTRLFSLFLATLLGLSVLVACRHDASHSKTATTDTDQTSVEGKTDKSASVGTAQPDRDIEDPEDNVPRKLVAQQDGGEAYWVLPGPRKLSPRVFGTKENPKRLVKPKIKQAKGTVSKLLKKLPLLVGLPESGPWGRTSTNGGQVLKHGSPFGNKMKPVSDAAELQFNAEFQDNQLEDGGDTPIDTDDRASFNASFADPQGNTYSVKVAKAFQPPIPGWQTEGGVLMNSYIGGTTGTFIPLFPKAYTHAAFWGVGKITINEKKTVPRVVVFYITEQVRNGDGKLALDEQMPLNPRGVQAHLLVPPIKPVLGKGPVPKPVPTAFDLPEKAPKDKQPFISIFYPNPNITEGRQHVR